MDKTDYAGRVASYLCEHDTPIGEILADKMLSTMEGERPLTEEDAERWIYSISRHVEAKTKKTK